MMECDRLMNMVDTLEVEKTMVDNLAGIVFHSVK